MTELNPQELQKTIEHFKEASNSGHSLQCEWENMPNEQKRQIAIEVSKHPAELPNVHFTFGADVSLTQKDVTDPTCDARTEEQKRADSAALARGEFTQSEMTQKLEEFQGRA